MKRCRNNGCGNTWIWGAIASAIVAIGFVSCLNSRGEESDPGHVYLAGSSANTAILQKLAKAYEAGHRGQGIEVPPRSGSSGAVRAVLSGQTTLGRVARPLTKEELESGLVYVPFARDTIVFCTDTRVNATSLTAEQLAGIFAGEVEDWYEVGGYKVPVHVLIREPGEPGLGVIRSKLPAFRDLRFTNRSKVVFGDLEMLGQLNKYRPAIGWLTRSSMIEYAGTKAPVALDGVEPTPENVRSGRYPLTIEFGLIHRREKLNGAAAGFLDFVLSPAGRAILERHGLVPVEGGAS